MHIKTLASTSAAAHSAAARSSSARESATALEAAASAILLRAIGAGLPSLILAVERIDRFASGRTLLRPVGGQ